MVSKALAVGAYHAKLRAIASLGVDLSLIIPTSWGSQPSEVAEAENYKITTLSCIGSGHLQHLYPNALSIFKACRCDLVHIDEEPFSAVTWEVLTIARLRETPAIFFTWQNLFERYRFYGRFFESYAFRHAQGGIAGNEETRDILYKRGFRKPVWVIPQFGVDPEIFKKMDSNGLRESVGLAGKFIVGFMGRLVEEKGIDTLLSAMKCLSEDVVALVVGSGPFQAHLKQLSLDLGLAKRVIWLPSIPSLEVPKYLNAFDVLVLPSRTWPKWKEQFGRVLVEAMACEVPVIGSNCGEIPNVIGEASYIFPEGDAGTLAELLRELQVNASLRRSLGLQGRNRVLAHFTQAEIARRTIEVYRDVLANRPARTRGSLRS